MNSFVYYTPTKVFFGEDAESHIGEALKSYGATKVMLHYGGGSIKKNGLYDRVVAELNKAEIPFVDFGGVEPNPKVELVREAVKVCREAGVDFILGVGGGSVSDSAKAISFAVPSALDAWDIIVNNMPPKKPIGMGLVLTIAAAGSEMSNSCVITNGATNLKRGCNNDQARPVFAFLNPKNTLTVPAYHTSAGAVDIMMHTMERYLTSDPDMPLTDSFAEGLLSSTIESGNRLSVNPNDTEARGEIMWASSLAHNDITGCGRNRTFTAHKIEHDISGYHDEVTHGAGLAVVFPAWCKYSYKDGIDRFYKWAVKVWGAGQNENKEEAILEGIKNMQNCYKNWGMPITMAELGVKPDEYETIANLTTSNDSVKLKSFGGKLLGTKEIIEIYKLMEG
ncbi:MAG: iron-containing alcohol dehydrogenase [Synergistaceae bacterium]